MDAIARELQISKGTVKNHTAEANRFKRQNLKNSDRDSIWSFDAGALLPALNSSLHSIFSFIFKIFGLQSIPLSGLGCIDSKPPEKNEGRATNKIAVGPLSGQSVFGGGTGKTITLNGSLCPKN